MNQDAPLGAPSDERPEVFYTSSLATDPNPILRFVHRRRLAADLALVRRHGGPDRRFLDFGCGDGPIVRGAADAYQHVGGVDTHAAALEAARRLGVPSNGDYGLVDEADNLTDRFGPFDTVGIFQKDFSAWNLKTFLEKRCRIVETRFLPVNALGWMNLAGDLRLQVALVGRELHRVQLFLTVHEGRREVPLV